MKKSELIIGIVSAVAVAGSGTTAAVSVVNQANTRSIVSTELNDEGHLIVHYSDDTLDDLGVAVGAKGEDGTNGTTPTITIGANGNWFINGTDSGVRAQGDKGDTGEQGVKGDTGATGATGAQGAKGDKGDTGETGAKGEDGTDGTTPTITIGANGNWFINGTDTGVRAQGDKGDKGDTGEAPEDSVQLAFVKRLNAILDKDQNAHNTYHSIMALLNEKGITATNIENNEVLWDSVNDCFAYESGSDIVYEAYSADISDMLDVDDFRLWKVVSEPVAYNAQTYSMYWNSTADFTEDLAVGFDAGENTTIAQLTYLGKVGETKEVTIRTNGSDLVVNSATDTVNHYGIADSVRIQRIAPDSFHAFGIINDVAFETGHLVLEEGSSVDTVYLKANEGEFEDLHITLKNDVVPSFVCDDIGTDLEEDKLVVEVSKEEKSEFIYIKAGLPYVDTIIKDENETVVASPTAEATEVATNLLHDESANYLARVGDTTYKSIGEAVTAASENDTIYLYDVKHSSTITPLSETTITINKNLTFKGAGNPTFRVPNSLNLFDVKNEKRLEIDGVNFEGGARFTRTENGKDSTIDSVHDCLDSSNSNYATLLRNNGNFISVSGTGSLVVKNSTFKGFFQNVELVETTIKSSSIIYARGTNSDNKASITIENTTFSDNAGNSGLVVNIDQYCDITMTNCDIKNNASLRNSNHGLLKIYIDSNLTMNNCSLTGNSFCGNGGLIGAYSYSTTPLCKIVLNDTIIKDNYGGYFLTDWYVSKTFNNGRFCLIYIHNNTQLEMNGSTMIDNTIYGKTHTAGEDKTVADSNYIAGHYVYIYGMVFITNESVLKSKLVSVTINDSTIKNNFYTHLEGDKVEVVVGGYIRKSSSELYDYWWNISEDSDIKGYVGDIYHNTDLVDNPLDVVYPIA